MKMNEMPFWEKPREKLLKYGAEALTTAEVLAILLRTGTRDKSALELAGELLHSDRRGLRYLAEASPEELRRINGLGEAKVCELLAAMELGKRLACLPAENNENIRCAQDIAGLFMERLRHEKKEHFICLLINVRGDVIEANEVSVGDLNSASSHPREVFRNAIKRSAGSVAFVHNHPSGNPEPSEEDIRTTERLEACGKLLGIVVIDHIIIGDGQYCSMQSMGLMGRSAD